jgi:CheY-like chemotaxis protein
VTVANNGLEALTTAVTASPQVIVTDVNMPLLEGPDMIRMLRAIPRLSRVPVILMSGVDTEAGIPVERHLRKPFDPTALVDSVSRVAAGVVNAPTTEKKDRACEGLAAREQTDFVQDSAGTDGVSRHIRRGLELVYEQQARMQMLRRLGVDVDLAEQLHEALVSSVAALSGLDRSGGVMPLLASLHESSRYEPSQYESPLYEPQYEPYPAGSRMESCVRECWRMHALGYFLERAKRVAPVSPARKRC